MLADDRLIDDVIADRTPRHRDRRLAEVLALFRASGEDGAFPPGSRTAEGDDGPLGGSDRPGQAVAGRQQV